eukprot:6252743-Alexandrium_andersonii.AAC.1
MVAHLAAGALVRRAGLTSFARRFVCELALSRIVSCRHLRRPLRGRRIPTAVWEACRRLREPQWLRAKGARVCISASR